APNGKHLAVFTRKKDKERLEILSFPDGKERRPITVAEPNVQITPLGGACSTIRFSNRGERLLVRAVEQEEGESRLGLVVFDFKTGKITLHIPKSLSSPVFSRDDAKIAGIALDGKITLFDAAMGTLVREFAGELKGTAALLFSPDGKQLWTKTDQERQIHEWDIATGKELRRM